MRKTEKKTKHTQEGSKFDKIIKEGMQGALTLWLGPLLNIPHKKAELLTPELQTTVGRRADCILRITPEAGESYILHLEFQSQNSAEMDKRMFLYHALLYNEYELEVKQHIIYMGNATPNMPAHVPHLPCCRFPVHDMRELKAKDLLAAKVPEIVVMAILANHGEMEPQVLARKIAERLQELVKDKLRLKKYRAQFEMLSKLRNFQEIVTETLDTMPIYYDIETDVRYKQGFAKGEARGEAKGEARGKAEGKAIGITLTLKIQKRLREGGYSIEAIAKEFEVSQDDVIFIHQNS